MTKREFDCEKNMAALLKSSLPEDYEVIHCVVGADTGYCDYCDGVQGQKAALDNYLTGDIIVYDSEGKATYIDVKSTMRNSTGSVTCFKKNADYLSTFKTYLRRTDVNWYVSVDGRDNIKCFKKEDFEASLSEELIRESKYDDITLYVPLAVTGKYYTFEEMLNQL